VTQTGHGLPKSLEERAGYSNFQGARITDEWLKCDIYEVGSCWVRVRASPRPFVSSFLKASFRASQLKHTLIDNMDESLGSLSQQLEAKISKLKDALHYWKSWEAEYEGLKEELDEQVEPSAQEMVVITFRLGIL
jgi:hypothetical protein